MNSAKSSMGGIPFKSKIFFKLILPFLTPIPSPNLNTQNRIPTKKPNPLQLSKQNYLPLQERILTGFDKIPDLVVLRVIREVLCITIAFDLRCERCVEVSSQ